MFELGVVITVSILLCIREFFVVSIITQLKNTFYFNMKNFKCADFYRMIFDVPALYVV